MPKGENSQAVQILAEYDAAYHKENEMQLQQRLGNHLSIIYCVLLNQPQDKV